MVHELGFHTDGCQVGVGCNYVPGHKKEGAGLLVYWRTGHPGTFLFRELLPHWGIRLNKITSELQVEDADQIAFAFFYRFGVDTILDEPWLMTRTRIINPHVTNEPREETQTWVDDLDVPTVTRQLAIPKSPPTSSWTNRYSSSWLDRARGASSWSWKIGGHDSL